MKDSSVSEGPLHRPSEAWITTWSTKRSRYPPAPPPLPGAGPCCVFPELRARSRPPSALHVCETWSGVAQLFVTPVGAVLLGARSEQWLHSRARSRQLCVAWEPLRGPRRDPLRPGRAAVADTRAPPSPGPAAQMEGPLSDLSHRGGGSRLQTERKASKVGKGETPVLEGKRF